MPTLQFLLRCLQMAPASQLSPELKLKAQECPETPQDIQKLFQYIYAQPETERSAFVAKLVNPDFTKDYV